MKKTYITSDLHFSHANILKYNPATRQFRDVEHMNSEMIRMWNETVTADDLVYILGDVSFANVIKSVEIMKSLNGRKILVQGNHDSKLVKHNSFIECFEEIHQYLEIDYDGSKIIMSHFPFLEWNQMHRGSINFFGHLHGDKTGQEQYRCKDVGMDATGKIVILMEDAIKDALKGEIKNHH